MPLVPVVLCGGSGTRLWPLSRSHLPKQFIPLLSERTLFQETVLRLKGLPGLEQPIAITNEEHRFLAAEQLRQISVRPRTIMLEPEGRNTAPAIAAAALLALQTSPDAILVVLPADHAIEGVPEFHAAVRRAVALAERERLAVFGIVPSHPHTGYGYIKRGALVGEQSYAVERFVEKPRADTARRFIEEGGYAWNSGMFVFKAQRFVDELRAFRPDILESVRQAIERAELDLDFLRLDREAFLGSPSESIDYAVMEKTRDAAVVEVDFRWSDVGSWTALWDQGPRDEHGNVRRGDVVTRDTTESYLHSEGRLLGVVGLKGVIVVETADAVLVAEKSRAEDVKKMVEGLRAGSRPEHAAHRRVYRPWGYYESIDSGARFQVKRLMISPSAKISLQLHRRRAEHWVVVSGSAKVTCGEKELRLGPNESTYIPPGTRHRLENVGSEPLFVIEVQSGDYLGEDDIERFADDYRRR